MSDFDGMFRQSSKGFVKDHTDLLADRTSFQLSTPTVLTAYSLQLTANCLQLTANCLLLTSTRQ